MDIYLSELSNQSASFTFPTLPERIKMQSSAKYQTYDIIKKGTVEIPKGTEIDIISWSGFFHGEAKKKERMIRTWVSPADCKSILKKWMENGVELRLLVTDTSINYDVTISSFDYEEFGAFGSVEYNITFKVNKTLKIYTTEELNISSGVIKEELGARAEPEKSNSYTVVSGDNLWNIAKRFYNSGLEWSKLYSANKEAIEATAKNRGYSSSDNGHWIFPGQILTIP